MQTLTTLNLGQNKIGNEGAHDLSDALKTNEVRQVLFV